MDCTIRLVCALFAVTLVHSRSTRRRPVPVPEGWRDQLHESVLTLPSFIESLNGDTGSTSSESTEARNPLSAADAPRPDFTEDLKDPQVTGILPPSYLWPKSGRETIIHYTVPQRIERSQVANITAALETIQEQTGSCVQFQQVDEIGTKRNALREYIVFKLANDKNCYTHIGRRNGANPIWLSRSCLSEIGIIMHEVLHKLGLFHEHSRPDRSDFVSVHYQNIFPNVSNQFEEYHNMDTHNLPYDVESIMHYGPLNGAKNSMNPSLTLRSYFDGDKIKMGQREELSETDVKRVLLMYNCSTLDHLEEAWML
ncbi:high choriolytic enzyme 2-like [Paramacrobiotus metropolitanus]|uniref:high choriolytic enzyme 2-like n=1 Tax=Paramacrobiotus metropolitanus TaxID=2943436 RepID=UPI0024457972|nr:high choriolytic enzyme 2-like [Paramacrobiotus metropolitanus]